MSQSFNTEFVKAAGAPLVIAGLKESAGQGFEEPLPKDYCFPYPTVQEGDYVLINWPGPEHPGLWSAKVMEVYPHVQWSTASITLCFTGVVVPESASKGIASMFLPNVSTWEGFGPMDIHAIWRGRPSQNAEKEAAWLKTVASYNGETQDGHPSTPC